MNRHLLGTLVLLVLAAPAWAQDAEPEDPPRAYDFDDSAEYPEFPPQPADMPRERIDVVFDLVGRRRTLFVEPLQPFEFYVVAHHSRIAVRGFEMAVNLDPRITVLNREFTGINVSTVEDQYIVGIKPKFCLHGDTVVLVRYEAMLMEEGLTDLVIGLGPADKSSFEPPSPGYLVCVDDSDLRDYAWNEKCAVVNPVNETPDPVPGEEEDKPSFLKPIRGR